jgi:hypothetical protein
MQDNQYALIKIGVKIGYICVFYVYTKKEISDNLMLIKKEVKNAR